MLKITIFVVLVVFGLLFIGCEVSSDATFKVTYLCHAESYGFPPTDPREYKYDETAIVLGHGTLQKEGYTFKNWNTSPSGDGISYEVGAEVIIKGPVFLYAMWTKNSGT